MNEKQKPKRPYGDGGIYRRGRVWWVKWREVRRKPDGTVEYAQHFKSSKSEDKGFAQKVLRSELLKAGGRKRTDADPDKVTYEQMRENFLARCVANGRRSLKWRDGKPTLDTLPPLDAFFGGWRASEIRVADLNRFRAEFKAGGRSDARVNRCMATLRAMMRQAVEAEILTAAELPGHFPMVNEPNEARGAIFVERVWYESLLRKLKEPLRSALALAYNSGVRVGEMERLRWRHFNLAARRVSLPGEITKTGNPRAVPLPSDFALKPGKPDDLALPIGDRRKAWRAACVSVGAGWYECRACGARCDGRKCPTHGKRRDDKLVYHGLLLRHSRHSAVRNMVDAGVGETRIMETIGHTTRAMFDRYNIPRESDVDDVGAAVERFHRGAVTNRNQSAVNRRKRK